METIQSMYRDRVYINQGLTELLDFIPDHEQRVLDLGCGDGANARLLTARGKTVHGVTISEAEAAIANQHLERVHVADLEKWVWDYPDNSFDALVFCHVLEHLIEPTNTLRRYIPLVRPGGHIYIALPNPLFWKQRWQFTRGRFDYAETGLMDRTHLRFFSFRSAQEMIRSAGLKLTVRKALGNVPIPLVRKLIPGLCGRIDRFATRCFPGLFGYHMLFVGERPERSTDDA
jgi:2-polyprenyl-3-methyl-5-hydroxy-6-metoxy-1,4-benzoquinol methylase